VVIDVSRSSSSSSKGPQPVGEVLSRFLKRSGLAEKVEAAYEGVTDPADAAIADKPDSGASPEEVNDWWNGLSEEERQAVIAELRGVPTEEHEKFREWVDIILSNEGMEYPNLPDDFTETVAPAIEEWAEYLHEKIAQKRAEPVDDLISGLCEAELDGRRLTDEETVNIVALLLTAGHISSATLLSNLFLVLEEHPRAQAELRDDRALIPGAIEETLRYRSPFNCVFRILTEDTDILGEPMRKGQMVIAWIASANRDTTVFTDPDTFDIRRETNKHMAFGHGIHHCLGAFLARLEAKVFLNMVFDEFKEFRIDHDAVEFYDPDQLTARHLPVHVVRG
jgi:cytochrome P450 TylI